MQTIAIKCLQLFCIAHLFTTVYCDNILLDVSQDDVVLNRQASCTATCMVKNVTAVRTELNSLYKMKLKIPNIK